MNHATQLTGIVAICAVIAIGCSGSGPNHAQAEVVPSSSNTKVLADAYLFDTEITKDGRLTSLRLEVFDADSVVAVAGRAYLGKGAVRGRVAADSVIMYFPTTNQYLRETSKSRHSHDSCTQSLFGLNFLKFLRNIPLERDSVGGLNCTVTSTEGGSGMLARYSATAPGCNGYIELGYRSIAPNDWRLERFTLDDHAHIKIRALRRELRPSVKIKASQFQVDIPPDAERITP